MNRLVCIALVCGGLWGAGCGPAERPVSPVTAETEGRTQESWDVDLRLSEGGLPRLQLTAGYLARFDRGDSTFTRLQPAGGDPLVRAVFFDEAGGIRGRLRAGEIDYFEKDRRFEARMGVVVETETGRQLESEIVQWDEVGRVITTPGFVRLTTPTERIEGFRLRADEDLTNYAFSRVTGSVEVEE
ncbi:MAG: LPS export ABC transporter periplasmic protein LptC [Bacteroidota bacterium]